MAFPLPTLHEVTALLALRLRPRARDLLVSAVIAVLCCGSMPSTAYAVCADDADGDTICSDVDPCPDDGLDDADGDGKCVGPRFNSPKTGGNDNCPDDANSAQTDSDADGKGNACDLCPSAGGAAEDLCLTTGFWQARAPNVMKRHEGSEAIVNGLIYLIGGEEASLTVEVYNPLTNTWTTAPSLPAKRHHIQPIVVKNKIYVIGGLTLFPGPSVNTNYMFDPAHPELGWQTRAPLPTSRGAMGCAADGIRIYCAGGLSSTTGNTAINVFEVYNTVTNTWATLAPMPRHRDHFAAVIINGKYYAISGRDTDVLAKYTENDIYDIATNTWSPGAPIPTPRGGYAVAVMQGRIIVFSGEGGGSVNGVFPQVEEYDPVRNSWRVLTSIPTPRHGIGAAVTKVEDGQIERAYIASGGNEQGGSKTTVHEVFAYWSSDLVCYQPATAPNAEFLGAMITGTQFTGGADADPTLDNLSTPLIFANTTANLGEQVIVTDRVAFNVNMSRPGNWYLWGRFYYPGTPGSNDANSFLIKVEKDGIGKKFGNNRNFFRKWHWDGNGQTETNAPDGLLLGPLSSGVHKLFIGKREVSPGGQPRLDLICLNQSPNVPPTDEAACDASGACAPPGSTTSTTTVSTTTTTLAPADIVCVAAGGTNPVGSFVGNMTTGTQFTGGADADPLLDNLSTPLVFANSTTNSTGENGDRVAYMVPLGPGAWFLWGRFYNPGAPGSNDANSFFVKLDTGTLKKFGNNKDFFRKWHWGGDGAQETGASKGISLGTFTTGLHTVTVEKREVAPGGQPRLDVFCLTRDGVVPPTDAQACAASGACP